MKKEQAILCDIDGTIALRTDRGPHDYDLVVEDAPRPGMADLLRNLTKFYRLIYISGRPESCRPATEYWLGTHFFPYSTELYMRKNKDNRADTIVKAELYKTFIKPHFEVVGIFDDRKAVVDMWRKHGLLCFQVADGNF